MSNTFLYLTGTAWAAISSITAVLAIIVALFLHFSSASKKRKNLVDVVQNELSVNIDLLKKANSMKNGDLDGEVIPKTTFMVAIFVTMNFDTWDDNKQAIAEVTASDYIKYSEIINILKIIKSYSIDIKEKRGKGAYVALLQEQVDRCIILAEEKRNA